MNDLYLEWERIIARTSEAAASGESMAVAFLNLHAASALDVFPMMWMSGVFADDGIPQTRMSALPGRWVRQALN